MTETGTGAERPENAIAVVGMAGRFPGARDIAAFWLNLRDGVESITELTDQELLEAGVEAELLANPNYVKAAALLDDVELWDAGFFGFNPKEAAIMDPQHRHFLECAWEALEHAGYRPDAFGGAIGVFGGSGMNAYLWRNVLTDPELVRSTGFFLLRHTGNDKDFLTTRVSYCFDLKGPSVNVQTACSTSLVAIHMACQSLLNGECDLALAGGVTIEPRRTGYLYEEGEILSPDAHCRPFDAAAAGTVFGSGAGVVALRRLEDALEAGDTILAIVRGSAINNDGSGKVGYLAPSVDGQAAAIAEALAVADVSPDTVSYVEAHGTGTAVGDPIEVAALTQAYRLGTDRSGYCGLGSVKSNIGHLDTAAGVAGIIKTVLALQHEEIPPTLHFAAPHPAIDWPNSPFRVIGASQPWRRGANPRRAGVSSLGVGGTNAHVVLEEAPAPVAGSADRGTQLLLLSGRTPSAVDRRASDLAAHLEAHADQSLADVAYTLSVGRKDFRHRRFVVADTLERAVDKLLAAGPEQRARDAGESPRRVAFMFAGGGAQYAGMGAELYAREPVYREFMDRCLDIAARHVDTDLRGLLLKGAADGESQHLERPTTALPALFATQYALAQLLISWGIEPAAMIGHSMGEYTAACLAGVLSLEDAMAVVALRGRLFEKVEPGAMTSVPLAPDALKPLLDGRVSIAAVNGPELSVASGPVDAIAALEARLLERGIESRRIHIDTAAHSALLDPVLEEFRTRLERIRFEEPQRPFVSNLSGDWADAVEITSADYWVRHLRQTVRFSEGLQKLLDERDMVLLEVGPGRTLSTLARIHPLRDASQGVLGSMPHPEDATPDRSFLLDAIGQLWQHGVAIDWDAFWSPERRRRVPLPTYPFERQRYWIEPGRSATPATPASTGNARRADVGAWFSRPRWMPSVPPHVESADKTSRILLFRDGGGHADRLLARLRVAGHDVTVVERGSAFERTPDGHRIRPGRASDVEALLDATGERPLRILYLWTLDGLPVHDGAARQQAAVQAAFITPLHLLRALASRDSEQAVDLAFFTDGAVAVTGDEPAEPEKALVLGPARVAPREFAGLRAKVVDLQSMVEAPWQARRVADQLLAESLGGWADGVVAYRGEDRWVESFADVQLPAGRDAGSLVREGAVVLITGGTGGLAASVAAKLHEQARAKLVLVTRTALPPRETWPALAEGGGRVARAVRRILDLEALGAEVFVEHADVTDDAAMHDVVQRVRRHFGELHGVVHAAGVLDDALIAYKDDASALRVIAPKLAGTLALNRAVAGMELDFFVVFSSRSAVSGAPGQVDYTAANAFLDAFAHQRRAATGQATFSIGWDAWRETGMAADLARDAEGAPLAHPVFSTRRRREGALIVEGELDPDRHWVVDEHRVRDGDAILPGAAYLELIRAAWASEYGPGPLEIRDLVLLVPLAVPEKRAVRIRMAPGADGFAVTVSSRAAGDGGAWTVHARGTLRNVDAADVRHDPDCIRSRLRPPRTSEGVLRHAHLDFGPRWAALSRIATGEAEALAELELPESLHADLETWLLHPAMVDVATGAAQELVPGYRPDDHFYVPASFGRVMVRGALPPTVYSHLRYRAEDSRPGELITFDISVMDEAGREAMAVNDFAMMRVADRASVGHGSASAVTEPEDAAWQPAGPDLASAISPAEGAEAFARVLVRHAPAHVLVTPRPLAAVLADVPRTEARPRLAARQPSVDLPDTAPVESALIAHEALSEAAALAHADAPDRIRIVAFVVFDAAGRATVSELRRYLRGCVPAELVPNAFVELDALPRTPAGDIDREALPNPFAARDTHVAPRTPTEVAIAAIWKDLLGVDRVGVHDNFLDIGGHSLLGIRALARIEKATGARLHPNALSLQTLGQLAAEADRLAAAGTDGATSDDGNDADTESGLPRRLLSAMRQALGG